MSESDLEYMVYHAMNLMKDSKQINENATVELIDNIVESDENLISPIEITRYWLSLNSEHRKIFEKTFELVTESSFENYVATIIAQANA